MRTAKWEMRSGISLIVVLGFLAVLVILAVSLSVTMRVERLGAASYTDVTRARQLAYVALSRAMEDVDVRMSDDGVLYPTNTVYTFETGVSITNMLLPAEALWMLPGSDDPSNRIQSVRMQSIDLGGGVTGRVGYVAWDSSGYIDANVVDTNASGNRGFGQAPGDLKLSGTVLPELASRDGFRNTRATVWRRAETLAELWRLGSGSDVFWSSFPENFITFSLFPSALAPDASDKVSLGGGTVELRANQSLIQGRLSKAGMGLTPYQAGAVFSNLLDYVDADDIPQDINSFYTEAVPMLNEIIVSNTVTRGPDLGGGVYEYTHRVYVTIETWYPFPGNSKTYTLAPVPPPIEFGQCSPAALKPEPSDLLPVSQVQRQQGEYSLSVANVGGVVLVYEKKAQLLPNQFPSGRLIQRITANGTLRVQQSDGVIVDQADLSGADDLTLQIQNAAVPPAAGAPGIRQSWSAVDPRFNWRALITSVGLQSDKAWVVSQGGQATPGDINAVVPASLGGGKEGWSHMYVRNGQLNVELSGVGFGSAADLGYLCIGEPWKTVALWTTPDGRFNPVLDEFTVLTGTFSQGMVNVNSPSTGALASVFNEVPMGRYIGETIGQPLQPAAAVSNMAPALRSALAQNSRYTTNRSVAVIGEVITDDLRKLLNNNSPPGVLTNDAMVESLIRGTHRLFSYRQNLFTILLYSQVLGSGGAVIAEQRAVALVWRDPEVVTVDGVPTNRMFVRFFKWL